MSHNTGFAPIASKDACILILGSMPSEKSLQEQQYYAHPRNAFWPIVCNLLGASDDLSYQQRKQLLKAKQVALWDVLQSCYRKGSLDSNIDHATIKANDFNHFLSIHKQIKTVFFNGGEAEKLFRKNVLNELNNTSLYCIRLPSTSPAHAAMSREEKQVRWEVILTHI